MSLSTIILDISDNFWDKFYHKKRALFQKSFRFKKAWNKLRKSVHTGTRMELLCVKVREPKYVEIVEL